MAKGFPKTEDTSGSLDKIDLSGPITNEAAETVYAQRMVLRSPASGDAGAKTATGAPGASDEGMITRPLLYDASGNPLASSTTTPAAAARGLITRPMMPTDGTHAQPTMDAAARAGYQRQVDVSGYEISNVPTFAWAGGSTLGANKVHVAMHNFAGSLLVIRVRLLVVRSTQAAVTGALPSDLSLIRRTLTNTPNGSAVLNLCAPHDSVDSPLLDNTQWNLYSPVTTAPTGTQFQVSNSFTFQPDEPKLTTLDAPTMASIQDFAGMTVYDASRMWPCKPVTIRAGQSLELLQGATAGTGTLAIWLVFTVE